MRLRESHSQRVLDLWSWDSRPRAHTCLKRAFSFGQLFTHSSTKDSCKMQSEPGPVVGMGCYALAPEPMLGSGRNRDGGWPGPEQMGPGTEQ